MSNCKILANLLKYFIVDNYILFIINIFKTGEQTFVDWNVCLNAASTLVHTLFYESFHDFHMCLTCRWVVAATLMLHNNYSFVMKVISEKKSRNGTYLII